MDSRSRFQIAVANRLGAITNRSHVLSVRSRKQSDSDVSPIQAVRLLTAKEPMYDIPPLVYGELLEHVRLTTFPANAQLFDFGDTNNRFLYLLLGSISMKSKDGFVYRIDSSDEMARWPLAKLKPRRYKATTNSEGTLIAWVDDVWFDQMFEKYHNYVSPFFIADHAASDCF